MKISARYEPYIVKTCEDILSNTIVIFAKDVKTKKGVSRRYPLSEYYINPSMYVDHTVAQLGYLLDRRGIQLTIEDILGGPEYED